MTIQSLFKRPLHVILTSQDFSQFTPQVSYQPPELCYLILQSPYVAVHLLLLERRSLTYPDIPIAEELTWAVFIAIWPHSCSPITVEYLIALEDASWGASTSCWSQRPLFRRWNKTVLSGDATGPVCFSLSSSRRPEATMLNPNIWSSKARPKGNTLRASSVTTLLAVSMVYNEQVSHGNPPMKTDPPLEE